MPDILLTLRAPLTAPIDASVIVPDRFAGLETHQIAVLPLWSAEQPRDPIPLGDLFRIEGGRSDQVRVSGDCTLAEGLGQGMTGGRLIVEGDAGPNTGRAMQGGVILVQGSAGPNLGGSFPGASKGMTGGEIVVHGSAGWEAGARMRRGLIFIGGTTGPRPGRGMIAGTIVTGASVVDEPVRFNKRGSLVLLAAREAEPSGSNPYGPTYPYACTYRPPHLPLILSRLRAAHGAAVTDAQITGLYRRYNGDLTDVGKGEILVWTGP